LALIIGIRFEFNIGVRSVQAGAPVSGGGVYHCGALELHNNHDAHAQTTAANKVMSKTPV